MLDKVPLFPNFRNVIPDDFSWYQNYYKKIKPISDLSFNNLMVWLDLTNDLKISRIKECILLSYGDPFNKNEKSISILTDQIDLVTINNIFKYQKNNLMKQKISMLSEESINSIPSKDIKKIKITYDLDNTDYVIDIKRACDISHPSNKRFRKKIKIFIKEYGNDTLIRDMSLENNNEVDILLDGLSRWPQNFSDRKEPKNKSSIELLALNKLFKSTKTINHQCLGVFINNVISGFVIYHFPPHEKYAIGNHIKCDYNYKNIFDFIYLCSLSRIRSTGIKYYNIEQDLGIAGIRNHKQAMHPKYRIKRFNIEPVKSFI